MRLQMQGSRTRGMTVDLGPDVTDGRYVVVKNFRPTATVSEVLENRDYVFYRGDDRAEAERVMGGQQ